MKQKISRVITVVMAFLVAIAVTACSQKTSVSADGLEVKKIENESVFQLWEPQGDGLSTVSSSSQTAPRYHAVWPHLKDADSYSDRLSEVVSGWIDRYTAEAGGHKDVESTIGWFITGASEKYLTVTLVWKEHSGDQEKYRFSSLVLDRGDNSIIETKDLIDSTAKSSLATAIITKAVGEGLLQSQTKSASESDFDSLVQGTGITADGKLALFVTTRDMTTMTSTGLVAYLTGDQAKSVLSKSGKAWFAEKQNGTAAKAPGQPSGDHSANGAAASESGSASPSAPSSSAPLDNFGQSDNSVDCNVAKCIALTFDDGPGPYTDQLLDTLKAENVHATFFLVGTQVKSFRAQLKREFDEGHAIGNHTWTHPDLTKQAPAKFNTELDNTSAIIEEVTGKRPFLLRPPYGAWKKTLDSHGMAVIMWNVDTEDWKNKNVQIITQRALSGANNGAIILMHDIHKTTVQAVPGIIKALKQQGYTLVTIPQLLGSKLAPNTVFFSRGK